MKKHAKHLVAVVAVIMIAVCAMLGLSACNFNGIASRQLNMLADQMAYLMLGNDAYSWNVFFADPYESVGYENDGACTWYSYNAITAQDIEDICSVFEYFGAQVNRLNVSKLKGKDLATYYTLKHTVDSYLAYYGSGYAVEFSLMGGDYINSQGGYVADFTSCVENYNFRNINDVNNLLSMVESTQDAFESYLDFANDRAVSGHPLYDSTLVAMQEYLDDILEQGDEYYLYSFVNRKIDAVEFMTAEQKTVYKNAYASAITNSFMTGVSALNNGLNQYRGAVTETNASYLATYGNAGKAYYKWNFENKTGLRNVDISAVFEDLTDFYEIYSTKMDEVESYVESVKDTSPELYAEFNAYLSGEKKILDLTDPEEILAYVKEVAKELVPNLKNQPQIDFKYMDETVAKRSYTLAYYLRSPMDEVNSAEHITLNPYYIENSPSEPLLPTIAHEGYPGHLYSAVYAKEQGVSLLSGINTVSAFVEGWAVYMQLAVVDIIAKSTDSEALRLYCQYLYADTVTGYIMPILSDININYYGITVEQFVQSGIEEASARRIVETLMEMPAVYVSYGYGAYAMINLHDSAKQALGNRYNEVEFNAILLSDGMGPTLARAEKIAEDYISSK